MDMESKRTLVCSQAFILSSKQKKHCTCCITAPGHQEVEVLCSGGRSDFHDFKKNRLVNMPQTAAGDDNVNGEEGDGGYRSGWHNDSMSSVH